MYDIKKFDVMINQKLIEKNQIHIRNRNYISIDFYLFKTSRIQTNGEISEEELLKNTTKTTIQKYIKTKRKKQRKIIGKVLPNIPPLTGIYSKGSMIDQTINLTED